MRRRFGLALACLLLLGIVPACMGTDDEAAEQKEDVLASAEVVEALRKVGFRRLKVVSKDDPSVITFGRESQLPEDIIVIDHGPEDPSPDTSLYVRRFADAARAQAQLDAERMAAPPWSGPPVPSITQEAWNALAHEAERVCNVLVGSYNPKQDPALRKRFLTAIRRLQTLC
jgi:hypothetical protein